MHLRTFAPGAFLLAMLLAMSGLALPSWGAGTSGEGTTSWSGDPKVFAVGEFKGWISRPQLQGARHGPGGGAGAGLLRPQGRRDRVVVHDRRWGRSRTRQQPESYMILKGGGLHITEDPTTTGGYVGIEMGGTMENVLQLGFSLDYFHHSDNELVVLREGETNGLPLRAQQTVSESIAHLVPVGLTLRVRMPIPGSPVTPFLSGTLAYEMLFLENRGLAASNDPVLSQLEERETFIGFGWQAAAGVDLSLSQAFGLMAELGWHRSSPSQEIELDGESIDLRVDLDGPFLRGGLRIFM